MVRDPRILLAVAGVAVWLAFWLIIHTVKTAKAVMVAGAIFLGLGVIALFTAYFLGYQFPR